MRKDLDINFHPHPLTGDIATKTGDSAVKQSLKNIIMTNFYERGFNTEFGSDVTSNLFENNINGVLSQGIRQNIINAIENYEPQVEIIDVSVVNAESGHTLDIKIIYNITNELKEREFTIRV
jgi:hypothetical protein